VRDAAKKPDDLCGIVDPQSVCGNRVSHINRGEAPASIEKAVEVRVEKISDELPLIIAILH
jgi:hypothetical protein